MRIPKINNGTLVNVHTVGGLLTGNWRVSNEKEYIVLNNAYYADALHSVLDVAFVGLYEIISIQQVTGNKGLPTFCESDKIHAHALGVSL